MIPRSTLLSLTRGLPPDDPPEVTWPWPADPDYWLTRCEGFMVRGPNGVVGVVDSVVYGSRLDRPDMVAVRRAWPRTLRMVLVTDVVEVDPRQGCLVVGGGLHVRAARVGGFWGLRRLVHPHSRTQASDPLGSGR